MYLIDDVGLQNRLQDQLIFIGIATEPIKCHQISLSILNLPWNFARILSFFPTFFSSFFWDFFLDLFLDFFSDYFHNFFSEFLWNAADSSPVTASDSVSIAD